MSSISKIKRVKISPTTKKKISTRSRKFFFLLFFILLKDHKKSRKNSNIDTPCPLLRQEMNERFDGQFSILKSSIVAFFDPSRPSRCKHYYLFYNLYKKCNYMINFQGFFLQYCSQEMLSQFIKKRAYYFQKPHISSNKHHHHTHTPINFEFSRLDMENRHKLGLWNLLICSRLRFFPHVFLFSLVKPLRPLTSLEWLQVDRQIV